jgi:hypothetical protein
MLVISCVSQVRRRRDRTVARTDKREVTIGLCCEIMTSVGRMRYLEIFRIKENTNHRGSRTWT